MDFLLGIFTGIGLALFAGHYLNERRKKETKAKTAGHPPGTVGIYVDGKLIATGNPMQFSDELMTYKPPPYPVTTLEDLLQEAIANDDFEEAARLRDLINKK